VKADRMHSFQAHERSYHRANPLSFPMNCDDEGVAKCFGLEIARLLLDSSVRDFQIARYGKREADGERKSRASPAQLRVVRVHGKSKRYQA